MQEVQSKGTQPLKNLLLNHKTTYNSSFQNETFTYEIDGDRIIILLLNRCKKHKKRIKPQLTPEVILENFEKLKK